MTMDKSAIQMLQQTAIDADRLRIPPELDKRLIALPNDYNLHDLEAYHPERAQFRGTFDTQSIADFVAYVRARGGEGYIDADRHQATVFFDLGTKDNPGHARHRANLTLNKTAAYHALLQACGTKLDQRTLVDWLEDWSPNLLAFAQDGAHITLSNAVAAVRQVTIASKKETENTEGDFNAARSTLEEVEARSRLGLPAAFTFECEPYLGLPSRVFRLRLGVLTSHDKPTLTLRIVQKEAQDEAIAQDFKRVLIEEIGDKAPLTIGTFKP